MSPSTVQHPLMSRRRVLQTSMAGAVALPFVARRSRAAGALKPVSMTLDWIYEGPNLGFLVAHDQGYYRDAVDPIPKVLVGHCNSSSIQARRTFSGLSRISCRVATLICAHHPAPARHLLVALRRKA